VKKSFLAAGMTLAALTMTLSACAAAPGTGATSSAPVPAASSASSSSEAPAPATSNAAADFKACMVSDQGGFDDKSFNQTSYQGLLNAVKNLGVSEAHVQSTSAEQYATNVDSMVQAKCNIIIGVGFNLSDAIVAAAKANPNIEFAVVDDAPQGAPANVKPLVFNTNEAAFLAGYLAAGMTKSGTVGTYGGAPYPSVTIFMDGFAEGVAQHNKDKGSSVKVLGWDPAAPDKGAFVQSNQPFVDAAAGKQSAQNLVSQGADVLFPVAGNAGTGALQVAQASNGKITAIWVDTDGCVSASEYCNVLMTSVYKAMDVAVEQAIKDALNNQFSSAPYVGTLANKGVGIAPYHDFDATIPADLKAEIAALSDKIAAGTLKVPSAGAH